ncbi:uncharacterized protein ccdc142 [Polymixia lowei]
MDQSYHSNPETERDVRAMVTEGHRRPGLPADCETPEPLPSEEEQKIHDACTETEDLASHGSWSQSSISRSLQRAEALLRTTFNPSLKWLLRGRSQEDEEEEGSFVAAHNLVSRSSTRLLRLQQGMLGVASQWQLLGESQVSPQVCIKGLSQEGCVLLHSSSPTLQGHYGALWRLLEQRSQLLFVHEYTRRARYAAAYVSKLNRLLEGRLRPLDPTQKQDQPSSSSLTVGLSSISQELRIHLSHWSCLSSKVRSDCYLRPGLAQQTSLLAEMRQTLDSLGMQALVLMEHYVYVILSALAQTQLELIPRDVLEDIVAGTELYNQAVEENRVQRSAVHWRTVLVQQSDGFRRPCRPLSSRGCNPAVFPVKELMRILAMYRGNMAAKQLHHWVSQQSFLHCEAHLSHEAHLHPETLLTRGEQLHPQTQLYSGASTVCGSEWTWDQLEHTYCLLPPLYRPPRHPLLHPPLRPPPVLHPHPFVLTPDSNLDRPILENHSPVLAQHSLVQHRTESPFNSQTRINSASQCQPCVAQTGSTLPLSGFCQQDQASVELLFRALVSTSDLLAPLVPHISESMCSTTEPLVPIAIRTDMMTPNGRTDPMISQRPKAVKMMQGRIGTDSVMLDRLRTEPTQDQSFERSQQEQAELEMTTVTEHSRSPGGLSEGEPEEVKGEHEASLEQELFRRPHSVQWLDLSQSSVCAELLVEYRTMLWTHCSQALWLYFHLPPAGRAVGSINLWSDHMRFQLLHQLSQAYKTDLIPKDCNAMLDDFCLHLLISTAHTHWDHVLCCSLGSGLKDKCLPGSHQDSSAEMTSSEWDGSQVMTATMERFLQLSSPLLSSLHCHHSADSTESGPVSLCPSRLALHTCTVSLALATVQSTTVWVMSKAYQFLSSWSLNKFLLITQGDLKVLQVSLERLLQQTETLMMDEDNNLHHYPHHHHHYHHQVLMIQKVGALRKAVSELQAFSSLVLKIFSSDCKRMSGQIFEQTMPTAKHWRLNYKTEFPCSPSEYASLAAQTVVVQVLEGVAPLSDDARMQTLSVTMTAFLEAWMEHILKQKIKFSIQGALQLKQDFDLIRELIQSDQYSLSAELHQQLLNLRIFQQVDSAVVCLLQQPQTKPYVQSRGWGPFRRCCPTTSTGSSIDVAVGGSITNLESMEGEGLTQSGPSLLTSDTPMAAPVPPGEPYLAPSLTLGTAQQQWMDLRIHSSSPRWRLPGLHCFSKSEP